MIAGGAMNPSGRCVDGRQRRCVEKFGSNEGDGGSLIGCEGAKGAG